MIVKNVKLGVRVNVLQYNDALQSHNLVVLVDIQLQGFKTNIQHFWKRNDFIFFFFPHTLPELEIPDNANVFYAVNRSDEAMHFILRRKADQVLYE